MIACFSLAVFFCVARNMERARSLMECTMKFLMGVERDETRICGNKD